MRDKISWYIATTKIKITEIIPFCEKTNVKSRTVLFSMDVMNLDTNIPQNKGIKIICKAYENFYKDNLFLHITSRKWTLIEFILKEKFSYFNGKHYLQTHETAMGTKTAVFFINIFMAYIETTTLSKTVFKPTVWKCYIDDIFPFGT